MTIRLTPELEALIREDVERGPYASADEYVARAVEMLHEQLALLADERVEVRAKLDEGFAESERGELIDGADVYEMIMRGREARRQRAS